MDERTGYNAVEYARQRMLTAMADYQELIDKVTLATADKPLTGRDEREAARENLLWTLERLAEKATTGPWFSQGGLIHAPDKGGIDVGALRAEVFEDEPWSNATYIVALLNAAPELIAALRAATPTAPALDVDYAPPLPEEGCSCSACRYLVRKQAEYHAALSPTTETPE